MRYSQLLLEFDLQATIKNYASRVLEVAIEDIRFQTTLEVKAFGRWEHGYGFHWAKNEKRRNKLMGAIAVELLIDLDPTPNKSYWRWIIERYINFGFMYEDGTRLTNALRKFTALKVNRYFQRNPDVGAFADISRFKKLHDLEDFLFSIPDESEVSNSTKDKPKPDEYSILADTSKWRIVIPKTEKAASYFGRNTKWCTTSENGGMFDSYSKQGPLYIVIDKPNNRRWQFHFKTGQFMDERDRPIDLTSPELDDIWVLVDWPWDDLRFNFFIELVGTRSKIGFTIRTNIKSPEKCMWALDEYSVESFPELLDTAKRVMSDYKPEITDLGDVTIYSFDKITDMYGFDIDHFGQRSLSWEIAPNHGVLSKFPGAAIVINKSDPDDRYYFISYRNDAITVVSQESGRTQSHYVSSIQNELARNPHSTEILPKFPEYKDRWAEFWPYITKAWGLKFTNLTRI